MIGTSLIEQFVQAVAVSHRVRGYDRCSALLIAAPEHGKTTIARGTHAKHVCRVAVMSGLSVLKELKEHPETEFLLYNDLSAVRAMSHQASALLIVLLNQLTQGESGIVAFAGKGSEQITRTIGIIGCIPFKIFKDNRSRWQDMGFVSRMIPFAYSYPDDLFVRIKNAIDDGQRNGAGPKLTTERRSIAVKVTPKQTRTIRQLADLRAKELGQHGIRLLQNYHVLIRARAVLQKRDRVTAEDIAFLKAVDAHVSVSTCPPLA